MSDPARPSGGSLIESYPEVRQILAPDYATAPASEVERALAEAFGDIDPEALEDFLGSLKAFGRHIGRRAPQILSGAATGAGTGAVAGPWGAAIGALLGAGAGALTGGGSSGSGRRRPRRRPPRAQPGARPATGPAPRQRGRARGPARPAAPAANPAAAALLQTLLRPEVMQALLSMAAGTRGRQTVRIGQTGVPVAAVANAVDELAQAAALAHHAAVGARGEDAPEYLVGPEGELLVDPASPEQRAAVVLELIAEDDRRRARSRRRNRRCRDRARAFLGRLNGLPQARRRDYLQGLRSLDQRLRALPRSRRRSERERLAPQTRQALVGYRCYRRLLRARRRTARAQASPPRRRAA